MLSARIECSSALIHSFDHICVACMMQCWSKISSKSFSRVEISHIAKMVGLDVSAVERKLSQMILDKAIVGVLDQGEGCLIIFEEKGRDTAYDCALETIDKLNNVVEELFRNQAALLE